MVSSASKDVSQLLKNSLPLSKTAEECFQIFQKELDVVTSNEKFHTQPKKYVTGLVESIILHKDNLTEEAKKAIVKVSSAVFSQFYQKKSQIPTALFFPSDESEKVVLDWLAKATKTLEVCMFCISNNNLADALVAAHEKGVKVRVITDDEQSKEMGSDIQDLCEKGVDVEMDQDKSARMHNKFAIIDGTVLINGSFNWTAQAVKKNQENVTILDDKDLVSLYSIEFEKLWKQFEGGKVIKTGKLSKRFDVKIKEPKVKEPKAKEPKAKEPKAKETKVKEPKVKEPKEAKTKESKTKETKKKDQKIKA